QQQQFDLGKGADYEHEGLVATLKATYNRRSAPEFLGAIRGLPDPLQLTFRVDIEVAKDGTVRLKTTRRLPTWVDEFQAELQHYLQTLPESVHKLAHDTVRPEVEEERILRPGEKLPGPVWSVALDYSGCATQDEVVELHHSAGGTLPLGKWAFG